jgi:hypothetical protein
VLSLPNPITFIRCFTGALGSSRVLRFSVPPALPQNGACSSFSPLALPSSKKAGAAGSVFVDHGPGFVVKDADGKEPLVKIITGIEQREETVVLPDATDATNHYTLLRYLTPDGQPPGSLRDNCLIGLTEVTGMQATSEAVAAHLGSASINGAGPFRTWTRDGDPVNTVRIADTRGLSPYLGGGVLAEIKEHTPVRFRSLADCIVRPATSATGVISDPGDQGFVMIDMMSQFAPGGIEQQMHVALQAVYSFEVGGGVGLRAPIYKKGGERRHGNGTQTGRRSMRSHHASPPHQPHSFNTISFPSLDGAELGEAWPPSKV